MAQKWNLTNEIFNADWDIPVLLASIPGTLAMCARHEDCKVVVITHQCNSSGPFSVWRRFPSADDDHLIEYIDRLSARSEACHVQVYERRAEGN